MPLFSNTSQFMVLSRIQPAFAARQKVMRMPQNLPVLASPQQVALVESSRLRAIYANRIDADTDTPSTIIKKGQVFFALKTIHSRAHIGWAVLPLSMFRRLRKDSKLLKEAETPVNTTRQTLARRRLHNTTAELFRLGRVCQSMLPLDIEAIRTLMKDIISFQQEYPPKSRRRDSVA